MPTPHAKIGQHRTERVFIKPEQGQHGIYERVFHGDAISTASTAASKASIVEVCRAG